MSSQQTAAYLARIRDRIAAIRQNTNTTSLKTKLTNTVRRDGLGKQGESTRQALAASLGEHDKGAQTSADALRDLGPSQRYWEGLNGEGGEDADWDGRSDSMEPLRDGDGEEPVDGDGRAERQDWELDMDREDERCMEVDRRMDLESLMAEERFLNGEVESEMYVAYHSLNSRAMRKTRLGEVERMYRSGGRYSTVGQRKGRELQDMFLKFSEESWNEQAPNARRQEDDDEVVSNPYPEDDEFIPLTRQPKNKSPAPGFRDPNKANINFSSKLPITSNPYPENAPTPLPQPLPTKQPPHTPHSPRIPSTLPSRFPIYPPDRTISPVAPFNASRHQLSPAHSTSTRSYQPSIPDLQANAYSNVEEYASNHHHHSMDQRGIQEHWHDLENYNKDSEWHLRRRVARSNSRQLALSSPVQYSRDRVFGSAGEDYEHYVRDGEGEVQEDEDGKQDFDSSSPEARTLALLETESRVEEKLSTKSPTEQKKQVEAKNWNKVGKILSSFTCRPGTVSPEDAAVPVADDVFTDAVAAVPRKYGMAYLSRKRAGTPRKEGDARLRERLLASKLSVPSEQRTQRIENKRRAIEDAGQDPRARKRSETTRRTSKPRVVNVESQTQCVIGPPVDLSKMIKRAPESIRTPSPLLASDAGFPRVEENVHHARREAHPGSSPSLSERLRHTNLEDLPFRFEVAQEIRNLLLDLERDQNESATTPTQQKVGQPDAIHQATTSPAERVHESPRGFSRPEIQTTTTTTTPQPNTSPRQTLDRHFRTQRQVNEQSVRRVRAAKSHSSNLTLPRSFRAPEMHSSVLSIPREPSPLVQVASIEEIRAAKAEEDDGDVEVEGDRDGGGQRAGGDELGEVEEEEKKEEEKEDEEDEDCTRAGNGMSDAHGLLRI